MRKATYLFGAIITFLSFISCSNDSEPASDPAKDKELAEWIKSCVLDDKGDIVFVKSDAADGLYAIPAGSAENAEWFVEDLTRTEWDGQPKTVSLGEEGSVRIAGSEKEGVYNTIEFRIKGVPAFNLDITSWEYLNNDNSYGMITNTFFSIKYCICGNCLNISSVNSSKDGKCPHCGWSDGLDGELKVGSLLCTTDAGYAYVVSHDNATEDDVKHCVGFVFYIGQHPKDDTNYFSYNGDIERKCHGYAMALYEADYCQWMCPAGSVEVGTGPEDAWNGYSNTRTMLYRTNWDLKVDNDMFHAAIACKNYKGDNRTAPRNSSGWFLPSIAQLETIGSNYSEIFSYGYSTIYEKSDLGPEHFGLRRTYYWSSTEEISYHPELQVYVYTEGNRWHQYKDQKAYVRPILAF